MHIFDKYLNDENADKRERAKLWRTSIGLQAVDNLTISASLLKWHVNIEREKYQWMNSIK